MIACFQLINIGFLIVFSIIVNNPAILLLGGIGLLILMVCSKNIEDSTYKQLIISIMISFAFMLLAYWGMIETYGIPYYGGDDQNFEQFGHQIFQSGIMRFSAIPYIKGMWYAKGYLLVIAWIERLANLVGEYSTFLPRILNMYLWLSISVLTYKRYKNKIENSHLAKKGLLVLSVFPNALYISAHVYRDTLVCFLIVVLVFQFEDLLTVIQRKKISLALVPKIAILISGFYMLYYIRSQMCYCVAAIWVIGILERRIDLKRIQQTKKYIALASLFIILLLLMQATGALDLMKAIVNGYSDLRYSQTSGLSRFIFKTPLLPFGIILRAIWGLVSPFPGEILQADFLHQPISSIVTALVCFGTIYQIFLLPYLIKGLLKLDYESLRFMVIYVAIIATTFTFRHFLMIYPFSVEIILREYSTTSLERRRKSLLNVLFTLLIMSSLYLIYFILIKG